MDEIVLDSAVVEALPPNSEVLDVAEHGETHWSKGFRIDVEVNEEETSYFLKIFDRVRFATMAEAEFEGQKAMSAIIPDNVANPIGWGHCKDDETKDWYLVPFLELRSRPPSKMHLLEVLQTLHQRSQSPTGKFGFHVAPFNGGAPVVADWADNWEDFWTRDFLKQVAYLQQNRGDDPELAELAARFTEVVIPRLLRPLQTGGRNIKPCLLHGDLWDENVHTVPNTSTQTMKPMLFDPCPLYGHWEMDMQHLRTKRFAIGLDFIELYRSAAIDKSQPEDDFDDRIALYAIRSNIMIAATWPHLVAQLGEAKDEMLRLLEKHPHGLGGFKGDLTPTVSLSLEPGQTV